MTPSGPWSFHEHSNPSPCALASRVLRQGVYFSFHSHFYQALTTAYRQNHFDNQTYQRHNSPLPFDTPDSETMGDYRSSHFSTLRTPSVESLTSVEKTQKYSLDTTESQTALPLSYPPLSVELENDQRVRKRKVDHHLASDEAVFEEAASPRPSKRAKVKKAGDLYAPDLDPSAVPGPLPSPMVLAKELYYETSCTHIERKMGRTFSKIDPRPSKVLSVNWPKDAKKEDIEKMEAWSKKEARWSKISIPVEHRASWSFRPAPKNIQQTKTWLRSHGQTLAGADLPDNNDRPLQRPGYATEYSQETEEVSKLKKHFQPHPGALRVNEKNLEKFALGLQDFAAVRNFEDEDKFDPEDDFDINPPLATKRILKITDTPTLKKISVTKFTPVPENYVARLLRIMSHPPNETIEYENKIDKEHDGSIKEATEAMKHGNVSGASIPSERWYFNKDSQLASVAESNQETADSKLAALALMELSLQYTKDSQYPN